MAVSALSLSLVNAQDQPPKGPPPIDPRKTLERLGEMMDQDWKDRPEWAQMAASLLKGEPMAPGRGWFKQGEKRYNWDWVAQTYDADKNGTIVPDELGAGAKFGRELDRNGDRTLTSVDFETRSPMSVSDPSARIAMMLFRYLDSDSNGKITPEEMSIFFQLMDQDHAGFLTAPDLQAVLRPPMASSAPPAEPSGMPAEYEPGVNPIKDLDMLMSGQFGSLTAGPAINDMAPDFTLRRQDGTGTVTLSQLRGKPVVLIFGSFT